MFHLISGLYAEWTKKERYNILMLGLSGGGKSCLLEKVKQVHTGSPALDPSRIAPTVGQNVFKLTLPSAYLHFWDLGGGAMVRSLWAQYYDDADALVWVVDATDYEVRGKGKGKAIDGAQESWDALQTVLQREEMEGRPVLILANKVDGPDVPSADQVKQQVKDWFQAMMDEDAISIPEWEIIPTSALDGQVPIHHD